MTLSLQDIERLLKNSTEGEWSGDAGEIVIGGFFNCRVNSNNRYGDAELIAAAPALARQLIVVMKENEILRAHQGTTENMLSEFAHRIERRQAATKETP